MFFELSIRNIQREIPLELIAAINGLQSFTTQRMATELFDVGIKLLREEYKLFKPSIPLPYKLFLIYESPSSDKLAVLSYLRPYEEPYYDKLSVGLSESNSNFVMGIVREKGYAFRKELERSTLSLLRDVANPLSNYSKRSLPSPAFIIFNSLDKGDLEVKSRKIDL